MTTPPETALDQLARVRKLLETAESFAEKSKAEGDEAYKTAESYRDKAFELAARYEIDMALARASGDPRAIEDVLINLVFDMNRPFAQQKLLASIVYSAFGCTLIDIGQRRDIRGRVHAFGFKSDMNQANMLLTSLVIQATRESVKRYRDYLRNFEPWSCDECGGTEYTPIPMDDGYYQCINCYHEFYSSRVPASKPDRRSVWYRSFWNGWVNALSPRIKQAHARVKEQAVQQMGASTELALRTRDVAVKAEQTRYYPALRQIRSRRSRGSGYSAGHEAGRQADIGSGKLGSRKGEIGR